MSTVKMTDGPLFTLCSGVTEAVVDSAAATAAAASQPFI